MWSGHGRTKEGLPKTIGSFLLSPPHLSAIAPVAHSDSGRRFYLVTSLWVKTTMFQCVGISYLDLNLKFEFEMGLKTHTSH